jgi:hypothetical protein
MASGQVYAAAWRGSNAASKSFAQRNRPAAALLRAGLSYIVRASTPNLSCSKQESLRRRGRQSWQPITTSVAFE